MNEPQPLIEDEAPTSETPAGKPAHIERYRAVLHRALARAERLSTVIVAKAERDDKAEAAAAELIAPTPAAPPAEKPAKPAIALPELADAYDRIDRAMRRAIILALKLEQLAAAPKATQSDPRPAPTPEQTAEAAAKRAAARKQILRNVEDSIIRGDLDPSETTQLNTELGDRLDSLDLEDEIGTRPIPEIIADICRDLGLGAQSGIRKWKRRTPTDIEILRTKAAAPPRLPLPSGEGRGEGPSPNSEIPQPPKTPSWITTSIAPPPDPGRTPHQPHTQ